MTKPKSVDSIAVKRRSQRALSKMLVGKSAIEQARIVRELAAQSPLWRRLADPKDARGPKAARGAGERRSAG